MSATEAKRFILVALLFAMAVVTVSVRAAVLTPVTVTGFNRDVVVENTATGPPYTNFALNFNAGENTAFYQTNLPGKANGLPLTGRFTNSADGTIFQLQPYTASNALVLSSDTGTSNAPLTLTSPAMYSRIAVLADSGNGDAVGSGSLTLRFNDNSTFVTNYYAPDWFNNNSGSFYSVALQGFARVNLTNGNADGAPSNPRLYQSTINVFSLLGATNKPLSSLTFVKPSTAKSTGIYGISGLLSSAVTLPAVTNFGASNVLATSARLAGQVISTGDEVPLVTIYYGTNDGGANAAAWSNSVSLGYQGGAFAQTVSSLTSGRPYYFRASAQNAAGTTWAAPSLSFFTPFPAPAIITNLPASSITPFTAALNGQVLTNGGDVPSITIYYGPSNGGTTPGAWARSVSLGVQNGFFSKPVFNLSSNSTYFFTAFASNAFGVSWAAPSQSFTTISALPPPIPVLTHHNDNNRSGDNLNESSLNVGNVNTNTFGLLYSRPVDDQIYAQPLIATNVPIPGKGTHNLLLVATVNDSVYAFDADNAGVATPYWQTNFTGVFNGTNVVAVRNTDMTNACGGNYRDFSGNIGIVGTPVIDPATRIVYFVARTKEFTALTTNFVQRLYALDLATGTNRIDPVVISGSFAGGLATFDQLRNNQRPAITLANGNIFICWSSHCDWGPYHGWVMVYDANTLTQLAAYCDTPTGSNGGIWMSGQGPAADASGNVFLSVGNGSVGVSTNAADPTNRAMSFLKLNGADLSIMSWFTPYNWSFLNGGDWDLGSGGLLLPPGTTLAIGGGKSSSTVPANLYVVNRDNMGGLSLGSSDTNIIQAIPVTPTGLGFNHIHGAPVWWDAADGSYMYVWGESDRLHQFKFDKVNSVFFLPAAAQSPTPAWINGMTGGMLSLSANGTNAGTGILWGSHQFTGDANQAVRPGILHAYDAQNVTNELWNSEQFSPRDSVGSYAKFVPPTVANGKVYLATFSDRLNVYGLLPGGPPVVYQQPQSTTRFFRDPVVLSVAAGGSAPLVYRWFLNGTNAIAGATNSSLIIPSVQFSDAGTYSCVITNASGSTNSASAVLSVGANPTISYAETVLADDPIAYWRLDETNGSIAHDAWGGHDGQFFNVSLNQPGYNTNDTDPAAAFGIISNPDSYVGNIQGIDFSTSANNAAFSIEAWVNGPTQTNDSGIVTFGYGGGGEQFNLDTGGTGHRFRFGVRDANNVAHNAAGTLGPSNTWQHLVGVCDEAHSLVRLYVNGVSNANATISGGVQMGTSPVSIGSRQKDFGSTYTLNFIGSIDEVAIYDYALSPAQILNHYLAGTNPVVSLYVERLGTNNTLLWSPGALQASPIIGGPFTNVPGAAPPYNINPTDPTRLFRVKVR
jgi:hypothetical protein